MPSSLDDDLLAVIVAAQNAENPAVTRAILTVGTSFALILAEIEDRKNERRNPFPGLSGEEVIRILHSQRPRRRG